MSLIEPSNSDFPVETIESIAVQPRIDVAPCQPTT
ncbi:hypothetical protein AWB78_07380 [Caballeronia calidae]|uniref:Uncharacterized protein n=1 Tax=Caballeronia calidae TaxID=1777139 RepID=A0A158EEH0_9BURK|nr:hypothetical protein AWB78_07380 [Caballeronia calidae]